jgi:hypothetical protein
MGFKKGLSTKNCIFVFILETKTIIPHLLWHLVNRFFCLVYLQRKFRILFVDKHSKL